MRRIYFLALIILALAGCGTKSSIKDSYLETIPFFNKTLIMEDSPHVMQQIMAIAEGDETLSVDGTILTIGDVSFKINLLGDGVTLISSIPPDDPKMEQVIKYFDSIYDPSPDNGTDDYYRWCKKGREGVYHDVCMRPLHSDEGGTTIMFS